jgi:hypothetical protein
LLPFDRLRDRLLKCPLERAPRIGGKKLFRGIEELHYYESATAKTGNGTLKQEYGGAFRSEAKNRRLPQLVERCSFTTPSDLMRHLNLKELIKCILWLHNTLLTYFKT